MEVSNSNKTKKINNLGKQTHNNNNSKRNKSFKKLNLYNRILNKIFHHYQHQEQPLQSNNNKFKNQNYPRSNYNC